jgi:hypothetical protein
MLNSGEYTGYADTHTGYICIYATCIYYLLDKLHLSFNKHCITFVIWLSTSYDNIC